MVVQCGMIGEWSEEWCFEDELQRRMRLVSTHKSREEDIKDKKSKRREI